MMGRARHAASCALAGVVCAAALCGGCDRGIVLPDSRPPAGEQSPLTDGQRRLLAAHGTASLEAYEAFARGAAAEAVAEKIRWFTRAVELDRRYAKAFLRRGVCHTAAGEYDQAIADFNRALQHKPDYAEAYVHRGLAHRRRGEYLAAVEDFGRAIDLEPHNALAYQCRAAAHLQVRAYDKAWADVRAVQRIGGTVDPALLAALRKATGRSD